MKPAIFSRKHTTCVRLGKSDIIEVDERVRRWLISCSSSVGLHYAAAQARLPLSCKPWQRHQFRPRQRGRASSLGRVLNLVVPANPPQLQSLDYRFVGSMHSSGRTLSLSLPVLLSQRMKLFLLL